MKKILLILITLYSFHAEAQNRYITKNGHIQFFSEAPLENIEAHNHQVAGILDLSKNEVAISLLIKAFKFDKSLMEEHFNENYLESDKFPKSALVGTLNLKEAIDPNKIGVYPVTIDGKLTLHGVTKAISITGTIEVQKTQLLAKAKFQISIKDYNIDIPTLVIKNIAEVVDVTVELPFIIEKK
jgi:hypothetical protein